MIHVPEAPRCPKVPVRWRAKTGSPEGRGLPEAPRRLKNTVQTGKMRAAPARSARREEATALARLQQLAAAWAKPEQKVPTPTGPIRKMPARVEPMQKAQTRTSLKR